MFGFSIIRTPIDINIIKELFLHGNYVKNNTVYNMGRCIQVDNLFDYHFVLGISKLYDDRTEGEYHVYKAKNSIPTSPYYDHKHEVIKLLKALSKEYNLSHSYIVNMKNRNFKIII